MPGGVYSLPQFLSGGGWWMQINPSHIKPGQSLIFGISDGGKEKVSEGGSTVDVPFSGSYTYLVTGKLTACKYHPAPANLHPSPPPGAPTPPPGLKKGNVVNIEMAGGIRFGRQ
jgi:hypothetical protein